MQDHKEAQKNIENPLDLMTDNHIDSYAAQNEALRFFGLDETATDYELEQKYFQFIKKYRGDPKANRNSLAEINEAYDVASGKRRDSVRQELARAEAFKLFGRTLKEWRVHFYYSWWKYILIGFALLFCFFVVKHFFFTPKIDLRIVAFGHFENYGSQIEEFSKERLDYIKPIMFLSNIVVDNSEPDDESTFHGSISSAAYLSLENDVLITDARTFPFFLFNYFPLDDYYATLLSELSEDQKSNIIPMWFSVAEYYELEYEYGFVEELEEITEEDRQRHIYGLLIKDPELIQAMGFENRWTNNEPSIVFCISQNAPDKEKSWTFIREILTENDWFFTENESLASQS